MGTRTITIVLTVSITLLILIGVYFLTKEPATNCDSIIEDNKLKIMEYEYSIKLLESEVRELELDSDSLTSLRKEAENNYQQTLKNLEKTEQKYRMSKIKYDEAIKNINSVDFITDTSRIDSIRRSFFN